MSSYAFVDFTHAGKLKFYCSASVKFASEVAVQLISKGNPLAVFPLESPKCYTGPHVVVTDLCILGSLRLLPMEHCDFLRTLIGNGAKPISCQ